MPERHRWLMLTLPAALINVAAIAAPSLSIRQWGPGDVMVNAGMTALEIDIDPGGTPPAAAILEWSCPVPDGDRLVWQRRIVLGTAPSRAWIPAQGAIDDAVHGTVRLLDAEHGDVLAEIDPATSEGAVTFVDSGTHVMLVVGTSRVGLETYDGSAFTDGRPDWSTTATVVRTVRTDDLPDRADALAGVGTIVWTGDAQGLAPPQADALRTWVERGGHLVVSLEPRGDSWGLNSSEGGLLSDILPQPPPATEVPVSRLAPLISPDDLQTSGARMPVRMFATDGASHWRQVHAVSPNRALTVTQRVGFGHVTVTGLDLTSPRLSALRTVSGGSTGPLPWATTFWNPVLGRTNTALTPTEVDAEALKPKTAPFMTFIDDGLPASSIEHTVAAGGRLLAVVATLGAYWLGVVPLMWVMLRRRRRLDLSWPVFCVLALVCGAGTWGIAQSLSIHAPGIRHLTIIDQWAGQPAHRVQSWLALQAPGNGRTRVDIDWIEQEQPVLIPWLDQAQRRVSFPATESVNHDIENAGSLPFIARTTTSTFSLDWTGVIDPDDWGGLFRTRSPISADVDDDGHLRLHGAITSLLPKPLEDVSIIVLGVGPPSSPEGLWFKIRGAIEPGAAINLETLDAATRGAGLHDQMEHLVRTLPIRPTHLDRFTRRAQLQALSLFGLLPPSITSENMGEITPHRRIGAALDLGPTLGQPVLIITGFLDDAPFPVATRLGGELVEDTSGEVLVRWIHPLVDVESPTSR